MCFSKNFIFFLLTVSAQIHAQPFELIKLGQWESPVVPPQVTQKYNDVKFWKHPDGTSYALLGGANEIYIIDITLPSQPVYITSVLGKSQNCINRDIEVNDSLLFAVADEGTASLQIYNLLYLPDSVHKIYDDDMLSRNAHNVTLSGKYMYLSKNFRAGKLYAMDIFDISNPESPLLIGTLIPPAPGGVPAFSYVHDVCVSGDTAFCSCGNGGLFIYNISNKQKPVLISSLTSYPLAGYNHSSVWYPKASCLYFTDENQGAGMKVTDLTNIKAPDISFVVQPSPGVTPHNPALSGDYVLLATYQDGVNIYSLKNPFQPEKMYYYDTYPQNAPGDYKGLMGCWTVVSGGQSGIYIASDTHNGLYILSTPFALGNLSEANYLGNFDIYPNPSASGVFYIHSDTKTCEIKLYNAHGQFLKSFVLTGILDMTGFDSGVYFLRLGDSIKKIVLNLQ